MTTGKTIALARQTLNNSFTIVLLSIYTNELKNYVHIKVYTWMFNHNCQNLAGTKMSFSKWMDFPHVLGTLPLHVKEYSDFLLDLSF